MRWHRHILNIGFGLLIGIGATSLHADEYHYVNMLVGNRAAGLGGAYRAIADDVTGCYYNPAGIALAPSPSLSGSMNAYFQSLKVYKDVLRQIDGTTLDWEQKSYSLLPNFFGIVKKFGAGSLGISYAVPDSTERNQKQEFNDILSVYSGNPIDRFVININDTDRTYLFGPSYALKIRDNFTLGATLYGYYRDEKIIRNQFLQFNQGEHYWSNYYETLQETGYRPSLGMIWEPIDKVAIGLTVSKTFLVSSHHEKQTLFRDSSSPDPYIVNGDVYDFSDPDTVYFSNQPSDDKTDYPLELSLGLAYFVSSKLLFSGDVTYHEPVVNRDAVWNFALGSEYYFTQAISLRAGFYSDMAATFEPSRTTPNQPEHVNMYCFNLGLSYFSGQSGITLGGGYGFGNGHAQIFSGSTTIQDVTIENLTIFIAATYAF